MEIYRGPNLGYFFETITKKINYTSMLSEKVSYRISLQIEKNLHLRL